MGMLKTRGCPYHCDSAKKVGCVFSSIIYGEERCLKEQLNENGNFTSIKVSMLFSYTFCGRNNNKTVRFGFRII